VLLPKTHLVSTLTWPVFCQHQFTSAPDMLLMKKSPHIDQMLTLLLHYPDAPCMCC
jgi:hypothetical protein